MDVERWMVECVFSDSCHKVMMRNKHIPQFEAQVRAIEARWRDEKPPVCPACGADSVDLFTGDGDATTDFLACGACGAESEELGVLLGEPVAECG